MLLKNYIQIRRPMKMKKILRMAEIGVLGAETSEALLKEFPNLVWVGVAPSLAPPPPLGCLHACLHK